jgi:hypothetical protein
MIAMVMGYKLAKSRLAQNDMKKILIVACCQYFVDSLYSIGAPIPYFGKLTSVLLNFFSIMMMYLISVEGRKTFAILSLREMIIN